MKLNELLETLAVVFGLIGCSVFLGSLLFFYWVPFMRNLAFIGFLGSALILAYGYMKLKKEK